MKYYSIFSIVFFNYVKLIHEFIFKGLLKAGGLLKIVINQRKNANSIF